MKGFCISLDVSKGSSFYQGFKGFDEPITKPKKIEHNLEGFKELLKLKDSIKKEYDSDCIVIFESTGIYHKALQTYLDEHDFKYTIISPLLSAKVRKSDIRGTKTDAKDCSSIAKVFYYKLAWSYDKLKKYDLAKKAYERFLFNDNNIGKTNYGWAWYSYGNLYYYGEGVPVNKTKAKEMFRNAVKYGYENAKKYI